MPHPMMNDLKNDSRKYQKLRESMVESQIEARGVRNPAVLSAMRKVPRHLFVSEALMDQAYTDSPLPIGEYQTISQPYIVALMTEALELTKNDRVLEIGTGSGYQAAILAQIVFRVYTIETIRSLHLQSRRLFDLLNYHNIVTRYGDGTLGWKDESPFDAVIVTAGAPDIPEPLVQQLAPGGRMILPVGDRHLQKLVKLIKDPDGGIHQYKLGDCRFVQLIGDFGWEKP